MDEKGKLLFVDSLRNGFVAATRATAFAAVSPLKAKECPFANLPEKKAAHRMDREKMQRVTWVRPVIKAEIAFNEMTSSGHLRHSKFLRLREDDDLRPE
jgi:ATP-dependent DNA ligase